MNKEKIFLVIVSLTTATAYTGLWLGVRVPEFSDWIAKNRVVEAFGTGIIKNQKIQKIKKGNGLPNL